MNAKHELPRPGDWISLETVCLKLWGHLWQIPNTIDFNSTNDQGQNGVDIVGIPKNEDGYFGIQCKNKQLHLKSGESNSISKKVIAEEIAKAESFTPPLKHLIIATSLSKDKEVEIYVRELNLERIKNGRFSVQICFWDFISDKLQENSVLKAWYLDGNDLTSSYAVQVRLDNGLTEKTFHPDFVMELQNHRHITKQEEEEEERETKEVFERIKYDKTLFSRKERLITKIESWNLFNKKDKISEVKLISINGKPPKSHLPYQLKGSALSLRLDEIDHQPVCDFKLYIKNTGTKTIEDYKIEFDVSGKFEEFDIKGPRISEAINKTYQSHSRKAGNNKGIIKPVENLLVQQDSFKSYEFHIKPIMIGETDVTINWKLIARDFHDAGTLLLKIKPVYEQIESIWIIHPNTKPSNKFVFRYKRVKGIIQPNF